MAFKYDPSMAFACLPAGRYPAVLTAVAEGSTRRGLPMLVLTFDVSDGERGRQLRGWIVNPTSLFLLRELASAFDSSPAFESGVFDAERTIGCELLVELRVVCTDMFGDQNSIAHYHRANPGEPVRRVVLKQPASQDRSPAHPPANVADDDIPF